MSSAQAESDSAYAACRPYRPIITVSVILATILQTLDSTIANVALPHMQGALSATSDQTAWIVTSYLIAAALATPLIGWTVARYGRRWMLLFSMAGFVGASMACGAAQSLPQMVVFRLMQGICGAGLIPLGQSVILDIYRPEERAGAMAMWSVGVMLGPVVGPTLGAFLTETYSWRYVFYINLPLGLLGLTGIALYLPETRRSRPGFDFIGFASLSMGIAGLQLVLDRGVTKDWFSSSEIMIEAGLSALGFYLFAVHLWLSPNTIVNRALFRDRNFVACLFMQFACGTVLNATSVLLPPYFQTLGDYPVLLSGLAMAPRGIGTIIASPLIGRLVAYVDPRHLMLCGVITLALSTYGMVGWTPDITVADQIPLVMMQGATISLVFVPLQIIAFGTLPAALRTDGASLIALMRSMGGSIGVAVMEATLAHGVQTAHAGIARQITPFAHPLQGPSLSGMLSSLPGRAMLDAAINRQAQIIAYTNDFLLMTLLVVPAGALVFFMRRPAPARP